jgi:hypothetical protein
VPISRNLPGKTEEKHGNINTDISFLTGIVTGKQNNKLQQPQDFDTQILQA